jgi:hypothetical protein
MRIDGSQNTFAYDSALWSSASLYNSDPANYDTPGVEMLLRPYLDTPPSQIMVIMTAVDGLPGSPIILANPVPASTLQQLFTDSLLQTDIDLSEWHNAVDGGGTYQNNCNYQGFNVAINSYEFRFGIIYNNENDCGSPDTAFGLGGAGSISAGQYVGCCPDVCIRLSPTFRAG